MRRGRGVRMGVGLVLVTMVTNGCAFGTRRVALQTPPVASIHGSAPVSTAAQGKIVLLAFADQRSNKRAVGEVRNRWGMHTADKGSAGLNWAATGSGYAASLENTLKESLAPLIADLQVALR